MSHSNIGQEPPTKKQKTTEPHAVAEDDLPEPGEWEDGVIQKYMSLALDGRQNGQFSTNLAPLGLHTPGQWVQFLRCLSEVCTRDEESLNSALVAPLSCPVFNAFVKNSQSNGMKTGVPSGFLDGGSSNPIFSRYMSKFVFFHRLREIEDGERSVEFDANFGHELSANLPRRLRDFVEATIPPWRGNFANSSALLGDIDDGFSQCTLEQTVRLLQPTIPRLSARSFSQNEYGKFPERRKGLPMMPSKILSVPVSDDNRSALVVCEGHTVPINRLLECLEWQYESVFGISPTLSPQPTDKEIQDSLSVMKQGLGDCFLFGKDEIVFYDSIRIHVVRFGMRHFKKYACLKEARAGISQEFPRESADSDDSVVIVGFWSKTLEWNSLEPTIRKQLAVMAREEYKMMTEDPERVENRRKVHSKALEVVWSSPEEFERGLREDNKECMERLETFAKEYNSLNPSFETHRIDRLKIDTIQDKGHINKVVRMSMAECQNIFPKATGPYKSVVVKLLDFANIGMYHQTRHHSWYADMNLNQFERHCVNGFVDEVECYLRIAHYNNTHSSEPPIHVPDLLDFGTCCIRDEHLNHLQGFYVVLEDLRDDSRPATPHSEIAYDIQRMKSLGITHEDMASRNEITRNGQAYLFDFNMVTIRRSPKRPENQIRSPDYISRP